jgi:Phage terminase, small subunit
MARTGRQPYDTTDVTPYGSGSGRLRPPASLGEPERRAFIDLVTTVPAGQFIASDLPLLIRWAELTVMCEQARGELAVQGMVVTDDKGKASVSPWFTIHAQATKALTGLALRLRLGPQSRASKAPKKTAGRVSYFERMELEGWRDDTGEAADDAERR